MSLRGRPGSGAHPYAAAANGYQQFTPEPAAQQQQQGSGTGYTVPVPASVYTEHTAYQERADSAVVLPPGAPAFAYAEHNIQASYVPPGNWEPSPEALQEAHAMSRVMDPDVEAHPMEDNDPDNGEVPAGAGAPLVAPDGQVFVREVSGKGLPGTTKQFSAPNFTESYDMEAKAFVTGKRPRVVFERPFHRKVRPSIVGWALMIFFLCAFGFYMYARAAHTLNLGPKYEWYGIVILVFEAIGATTSFLYGLNHLFYTINDDVPKELPRDKPVRTAEDYHIRVLVPCYKESLQILQLTIMALRESALPHNCSRTIYMCDDGKDPLKRDWVDSLGPDVIYVSGRIRKKGEMNGKSGNMNNVLAQIYPTGCFIPGNELIAVFDADQIAKPDFFLRTVSLFDAGDDVGMVLTPQYNSNLSRTNDVFNHSNNHFWQYMQPGYDALDFISCTGTNFLVRANAYQQAGWTPTWTLTEDFALGMEMKRYGWHCRYLNEYLAVGEAPDGVRNCYQQRSRWTKGHFQIFFSTKYCPLFRSKLPYMSRLLYCSGVWAYCVNAVLTPIFMGVPIVTIWVGVFPMRVNFWLALSSTIFYAANLSVLYHFKSFSHLPALWFAGLANQLFWWTYAKAWWRSFTSAVCCSKITFKATAKGGSKVGKSGFRDLWLLTLTLIINAITVAVGLFQVFTGAVIISPLLISIIWCLYNMIPPFLVLVYAAFGRKHVLSFFCFWAMIASTASIVCSLGLVWWIQASNGYVPSEYTGGAAQNEQYIGFLRQIRHWIDNGWQGVLHLTSPGNSGSG